MGLTLFKSELTMALRIILLFLFLLSSISMISAEVSELSIFLQRKVSCQWNLSPNNEHRQLHSITKEWRILLNKNIYNKTRYIVGAVSDSFGALGRYKKPHWKFLVFKKWALDVVSTLMDDMHPYRSEILFGTCWCAIGARFHLWNIVSVTRVMTKFLQTPFPSLLENAEIYNQVDQTWVSGSIISIDKVIQLTLYKVHWMHRCKVWQTINTTACIKTVSGTALFTCDIENLK